MSEWLASIADLAPLVAPAIDPGLRLRLGIVATAGPPLTVTIAKAPTATPCQRLASYAPVAGDKVAILESPGGTPLVLGKVVP